MATSYIGEVRIFGGNPNRLPSGWLLCNGQNIPVSQYQELYSLIGTTWGGDGVNNFGLPNLVGKVAIGQGAGPGLTQRTLAETGGEVNHTLIVAEMPTHSHGVNAATGLATTNVPSTLVMLGTPNTANDVLYTKGTNGTPLAAFDPAVVGSTGGGQPHTNVMPSLGITYMIAYVGVYPTQP